MQRSLQSESCETMLLGDEKWSEAIPAGSQFDCGIHLLLALWLPADLENNTTQRTGGCSGRQTYGPLTPHTQTPNTRPFPFACHGFLYFYLIHFLYLYFYSGAFGARVLGIKPTIKINVAGCNTIGGQTQAPTTSRHTNVVRWMSERLNWIGHYYWPGQPYNHFLASTRTHHSISISLYLYISI